MYINYATSKHLLDETHSDARMPTKANITLAIST